MFADWLKKLAPLSQPIRLKTKTNRDLLAHVFPRLSRLSIGSCRVYFCFDTRLKTAQYEGKLILITPEHW